MLPHARRTAPAAVTASLALALLLPGCSSESGSTASTTTAGSAPTAAASSSGVSGRPQAWVRGTKATLTNATGRTVSVGSSSGQGNAMPKTDDTPLPPGDSRSAAEDWSTSDGTSVAYRVIYANDDVLELLVGNPAFGTPYVMWRKGYNVGDWGGDGVPAPDGEVTFDENTSQTLSMEGHQVTVARNGDDADYKNWVITVTS